jgi:SAM-dependent methyltransferase
MKRYDIINRIIENKGYKNYLEIGVRDGECFKEICCENKIGVDPAPTSSDTTHIMTSDKFFENIDHETKFDIVFIDGLHLDFQVDRDIENSLRHLSEGGTIVLHDCNPPTKHHAKETPVFTPPANGDWNGTVYLSLIKLRLYKNDLKLVTVDTDWGVGILTKELSETLNAFPNDAISWEFFNYNRNQILNIVSPSQFEEMYPAYNIV